MKFPPLAHDAAIVLVGSFNPAIFHPSWLAQAGLVSDADVDEAKIGLVHPELAEFSIADITIRVEAERATFTTQVEPFVKAADFVQVIFGTLLSHTPIRQLGINYSLHFALENSEQRMALGRALAPVAPWGAWGEAVSGGGAKGLAGGLRTLVMEEASPPRREEGYRRVHLEPSLRVDIVDRSLGVYMLVNDHCDLGLNPQGATAAVEWCAANFDPSISEAKEIVSGLMEYASSL